MEQIKPKHLGSKSLFENSILERLSRTHISVPITIFFLYAVSLIYWSSAHTTLSLGSVVGLFLSGILTFTWVEYQVHRRVFHMDVISDARKKLQYTIHGVHHEFPKDKDRLAMPPVLSVTIATILLFFFRLILGDMSFSFLAGFLVGYAAYLLVHYMVHVFSPPKNFLKALWINHSIHHYKHGEAVFGVSSPLWDYVYGTMDKRDRNKNVAKANQNFAAKTLIVMALLSFAATACGPAVVTTRPVEPVVVIPASPGPGYVWVNGSWRWNHRGRVHNYVDGYWARPARPGSVYVEGGWHQSRGGWRYNRGHWR